MITAIKEKDKKTTHGMGEKKSPVSRIHKELLQFNIKKTQFKMAKDLHRPFFFFKALSCSLRNLSSPTRDQTRAPCSGSAES